MGKQNAVINNLVQLLGDHLMAKDYKVVASQGIRVKPLSQNSSIRN
ncbi:hypothetical protein DBT_1792 [Dissulfuribacter thermophilus]|uniref:Uncharacterized protein n=1 Tax=Dissulfuribacter thermophilus TaxID=1156395 RepID=A0A1B9F474_9BACT|nr:hypothetical protein [Dissulfuribacter thermophilus]OCC14732.1 hypothetical protein DBT_1792 [Dissulfuribacter thermophilus]